MKKVLILQSRPEDEASDNELDSFLKFGELKEDEIRRIRMEQGDIPKIDLDNYSSIIVGGGPYNVSDKKEKKDDKQKEAEAFLSDLMKEVEEKDFPFLGACYGLGLLNNYCGGIVSKEKYSENLEATEITLTEEAKKDLLFEGVPESFKAVVGHKEACQNIPDDMVLLASSEKCPVQMVRFKENIYATQFHPELDLEGTIVRINVYKHHGYFKPEDTQEIISNLEKADLTQVTKILKNFIDKYHRVQ